MDAEMYSTLVCSQLSFYFALCLDVYPFIRLWSTVASGHLVTTVGLLALSQFLTLTDNAVINPSVPHIFVCI